MQCIPKYFVNFSQISSQCPITSLRISEAFAEGLRISQNYIDTKSRFWAPFTALPVPARISWCLPVFPAPCFERGRRSRPKREASASQKVYRRLPQAGGVRRRGRSSIGKLSVANQSRRRFFHSPQPCSAAPCSSSATCGENSELRALEGRTI